MAQAMGPPLSPRETRRSGRRSAPSVSTSNSKSPDSDAAPKDPPQRPALVSSSSSGRNKRLKQEDVEDLVDDRKHGQSASTSSNASTQGSSNGRAKRKTKEKVPPLPPEDGSEVQLGIATAEIPAAEEEEEEQGVTRCVCGSTGEDDPDAGEFMVQCETCKVWQHGLCMGYDSEDQLHDGDYYCEQCRPELHTELLKRMQRRLRHSSSTSHHAAGPVSRLSRSHSPTHLAKQPSKRRNTMNSRDAAFDENLKEILESTAAEAGATYDAKSVASNGHTNGANEIDDPTEPVSANRKKRKRADIDTSNTKKRTRSMSTTSDRPGNLPLGLEETVVTAGAPPLAPPPKTSARNKRAGRKLAASHDPPSIPDGAEGIPPPPPTKRSGNSHRKGAKSARPPHSTAGNQGADSNSRRGQAGGAGTQNAAEASRAYRNSHAYVVSQQPLFTSWNLPDYLTHLEAMLPTETPRPLEVVAGSAGRESVERTMERGVKVKWPSKRMSVADMNKRVRALVEWVGREQANASDRAKRRDALKKALNEANRAVDGTTMVLDQAAYVGSPTDTSAKQGQSGEDLHLPSISSSMKDMEALMEELIGFQERFGPGVKRERRAVAAS